MLSPQLSTDDFIAGLRAAGVRRAAIVHDAQCGIRVSHPALEGLAAWAAADRTDFDRHEALFFEIGAESGHLLAAALHRTLRGQGAGGVRFWGYDTVEAFVRDGLRLSRGMGQKNALAGLWWGGGKGLIARRAEVDHRDPEVRRAIYRDYGRFISGLRGCYVTAEDVGTRPADMVEIHATTRFTTCVPEAMGGSGNPSRLTAEGVVVAMEAAFEHLGQGSLAGAHVAMQGLGNVAGFMVTSLLERDVARIDAVDIDEALVAQVRTDVADERLRARTVDASDQTILGTHCDVLAPNAVGGILNPETIARLNAPLVCGAANNQLADPDRDADLLRERGVLFVPDFLANRMGIVNCANEQYGWFDDDPAITAHLDRGAPEGVFQRTLEVLAAARDAGTTPWDEAVALADRLGEIPHPVWGDRTHRIIRHLFEGDWAAG
ncbi:MAG: Glu/Leu/Phe/Val dehydrogenase dimerization domain-containing protein [Pseudomonadota bacterium]